MEFKDYYKILGVDRKADKKAISQAFRKLARQHHPDVNQGKKDAEQRFKEINEAYQVLNDPDKRAKYDQLLELREHGGGWEDILRRGGARGDDGTFTVYGSGDLGDFSEFFQQLFGGSGGAPFAGASGRRRGRGQPRGFSVDLEDLLRQQAAGQAGQPAARGDLEGTVEISLEEAFHGAQRAVTIPAGGGRDAHTIDVTIPAGVRNGQRIRVSGQGQDGGDLYLTVAIRPHPIFTRQDDDLICDVTVPVWTAALGGEVEVPTLGGPVTMKIPPERQEGQTLRLRGRGMPHLRGEGAGDELVKIRLALPRPMTARDRELFEEMRRLHQAGAATS
jgi:curved DNA-binding protein